MYWRYQPANWKVFCTSCLHLCAYLLSLSLFLTRIFFAVVVFSLASKNKSFIATCLFRNRNNGKSDCQAVQLVFPSSVAGFLAWRKMELRLTGLPQCRKQKKICFLFIWFLTYPTQLFFTRNRLNHFFFSKRIYSSSLLKTSRIFTQRFKFWVSSKNAT